MLIFLFSHHNSAMLHASNQSASVRNASCLLGGRISMMASTMRSRVDCNQIVPLRLSTCKPPPLRKHRRRLPRPHGLATPSTPSSRKWATLINPGTINLSIKIRSSTTKAYGLTFITCIQIIPHRLSRDNDRGMSLGHLSLAWQAHQHHFAVEMIRSICTPAIRLTFLICATHQCRASAQVP